jgi:hypothetical protein
MIFIQRIVFKSIMNAKCIAFILIIFSASFTDIHAQGYMFDKERVVDFIKSPRFLEFGRIVNNPYGSDRNAYVELLPAMSEWQWSQKDDSLALGVELTFGGTSFIVFKNDIQAFMGMDKKQLGDYVVQKIRSVASSTQIEESSIVTSISEPIDSMYGLLNKVVFHNENNQIDGLGSILQYLFQTHFQLDGSPSKVQLIVPKYGFKRDSLNVSFAQLNDFFGSDVWELWLGKEETQFILYIKNKTFNYAHLFFANQERFINSEIPKLEFYAFIPDDNVKDIFKVHREKGDGLNLEIRIDNE